MEAAGGGEFGGGFEKARDNHGDHQIPLGTAGAGQDWLQAEAAQRAEGRRDMTVRGGAQNLEGVAGGDQGFAFEHATERVDLSCGPSGEIGESALHNFAVHAGGLAEEDGWRELRLGTDSTYMGK